MLTGAISVTSGIASVNGFSVVNEINKVRALLGYCPQFDALDPLLTPREHLEFYANIRNIPSSEVQKVIVNILFNIIANFIVLKFSFVV